MTDVSIIVTDVSIDSFNLERLFVSIERSVGVDVEVIYINNGQEDNTFNFLSEEFLPDSNLTYQVVNYKRRVNNQTLLNKALKASNGKVCLLVTSPDAYFEQDTLQKLYQALVSTEEVGFVYPSLQYSGLWRHKREAVAFNADLFREEFLANFMMWKKREVTVDNEKPLDVAILRGLLDQDVDGMPVINAVVNYEAR